MVPTLVRLDIIATMAGPVAELYQRWGPFCLAIEGKARIQRLLTSDDESGFLTTNDGDGISIRERAQVIELGEQELVALWYRTWAIVRAEWPGVRRVARVLLERGSMDGEEFEAEWRRLRTRRWTPPAGQPTSRKRALAAWF
jgi:hypothetical protein